MAEHGNDAHETGSEVMLCPMRAAFEVAAAYVSVTPDASDFAQQLDEEIGGLQVAVRVVPDASDLQGLVDEQDLTATSA